MNKCEPCEKNREQKRKETKKFFNQLLNIFTTAILLVGNFAISVILSGAYIDSTGESKKLLYVLLGVAFLNIIVFANLYIKAWKEG